MEHVQLDLLEAELRRLIRQDPFIQTLNIELEFVRPDHVCVRAADFAGLINSYGILHGGALFSLADTAAGFAAMTDGRHYVSQSSNFEFLSNTSCGPVYTDCQVLRRGRTIVVVEARVFSCGHELLAVGCFNMHVVDRAFVNAIVP